VAIRPGETLRGKYRLDAEIGRGGMGQVFAASDLDTGAQVAVKVVSRVLFDEVLMARLHREAEAASLIRSEYVPAVLEVSETEDGEVFLVMERLVGEPLSARLREKGTLPWSEVAKIGEDILRGLIDAHTAGVVHRDLKPSNVFLALKLGRTRAMVLDFGVCKLDTVDAERLTTTGEAIGTVAYMAPEQIRGASRVDERADLYAFGALVFEMLSGRLPHEGPTNMAILASKLESEAVRLSNHAQVDVPAGLDELLARTLARDPKERPGSAQELLRAWRTVSGARLVTPTPSTPFGVRMEADEAPTQVSGIAVPGSSGALPSSDPEPHPTQSALTAGVSLRKGSPGRLAFVLAACGLIAGFVGVAAFFARAPKTEPAVTATLPVPEPLTAVSIEPPVQAAPTATARPEEPAQPAQEPAQQETEAIELETVDAGAAPRKKYVPARVRHPAVGTSRPAGPHITDKPRY
jgi:serine/threonine protein kinase